MPLPDNDPAYNPLFSPWELSDEQRSERAAAWHVGIGDLDPIYTNYYAMAKQMRRRIINRDLDRAMTQHDERAWQHFFSTVYAFTFGAACLVACPLLAKDEQNHADAKEPEKYEIALIVLLVTVIRMLPGAVNYFYTSRLKDLTSEYMWDMEVLEEEHANNMLRQSFNEAQLREQRDIHDYRKHMYSRLFPAGAFLIHVTKVLLSDRDTLSRPLEYGYQMQFICTAGHLLLDYFTSQRYGGRNNTPALALANASDSISKQLFEASKSVQHINCALIRIQKGSLSANVIEINVAQTSAAIGGVQRYEEIYTHVNQILGSDSPLNWPVIRNPTQLSYPFSILISPSFNDDKLITQQINRLVNELQHILGTNAVPAQPSTAVSRPLVMSHYAQQQNPEVNEQAQRQAPRR